MKKASKVGFHHVIMNFSWLADPTAVELFGNKTTVQKWIRLNFSGAAQYEMLKFGATKQEVLEGEFTAVVDYFVEKEAPKEQKLIVSPDEALIQNTKDLVNYEDPSPLRDS